MKNLLLSLRTNDLDEVVFANRNKSYGAYALRNDYSNQLTKALFIGIAFFASVSAVPLVMNAFKSEVVLPKDDFSGREILVINDTETPKPKPDNPTPARVKTVANPEVTPVREIRKNKTLPTKKDFEGAAIGTETKPGPETTISVAPPISVGPPSATDHQPVSPPAPVEDPNVIIDGAKADVAADFKGGINAFRQKVAQSFDTSSIDQSGMVSATITFVVEKDGSISNIKITGANADFNQEAERTVKSIKTKWTPAQLKGKAVRSSFRMPISMRIE
ncbi:energy transducer TonB [Epilithonimonas vandammei]|uniref:energy transducer TonB n=1 Tax=Epilithonimonas vandammei TaxID=2487072 RepID=UPI0028972381|nr:energy transducer TonB [Epilithonimonas vandammei]